MKQLSIKQKLQLIWRLLDVLFTPSERKVIIIADDGKWSDYYQEADREQVVYMVDYTMRQFYINQFQQNGG